MVQRLLVNLREKWVPHNQMNGLFATAPMHFDEKGYVLPALQLVGVGGPSQLFDGSPVDVPSFRKFLPVGETCPFCQEEIGADDSVVWASRAGADGQPQRIFHVRCLQDAAKAGALTVVADDRLPGEHEQARRCDVPVRCTDLGAVGSAALCAKVTGAMWSPMLLLLPVAIGARRLVTNCGCWAGSSVRYDRTDRALILRYGEKEEELRLYCTTREAVELSQVTANVREASKPVQVEMTMTPPSIEIVAWLEQRLLETLKAALPLRKTCVACARSLQVRIFLQIMAMSSFGEAEICFKKHVYYPQYNNDSYRPTMY